MITYIEHILASIGRPQSWLCSQAGFSRQRYNRWKQGSSPRWSDVIRMAIVLSDASQIPVEKIVMDLVNITAKESDRA